MIVGKVWDSEYPWDVRVEKVCAALHSAGHAVHLFCRNRKGQPLRENVDGIELHRMPNWPSAGTWLDDVSSFPAFMNPRWVRHLDVGTTETRIDLLLCRDLPLSPLALRIGRRLGIPVVLDIAENYPAMLKQRFYWRDFKPHNLIVRNPVLAGLVERSVLPKADGVIVVVEESRDRIAKLGVHPSRLSVVSNTPTGSRISEMRRIADLRRTAEPAGSLRLVYLGLLGRSRGIDVLLAAMRILKDQDVRVHLDVIGSDENEPGYLARAERLKIADRVTFHGHVPYDQALRLVAQADIGVVPHHATEHWRTTIPNKLFDYMAAELPVVVSDAPPTKRVVVETGAGRVFRDRDPVDLAAQIRELTSLEQRRKLGAAGRRAVETRYNWDQDSRRLLGILERSIARHNSIPQTHIARARSRYARRGTPPSQSRR